MLRIAMVLALLWSSTAFADVINVEFKFTPFTGDTSADQVQAVAGVAKIYLNQMPVAEQEIAAEELPVMFEEREVAPAVWIPVASLGPAVRKGKNTIKVEFTPADPKQAYTARLHWALVTDTVTEEGDETGGSSTNMSGAGKEDKSGPGSVVVSHEFDASGFATDLPWHHYAPVKDIAAADKGALAKLVQSRIDAFQPDFSGIYAILSANENINLEELKKLKCLDKVYEAGVRIAAVPEDGMKFTVTGGPEVVIEAKDGMLFFPADPAAFEKVTDQDLQMCAGMALFGVFPPRLVVVKSPSGAWEIAY